MKNNITKAFTFLTVGMTAVSCSSQVQKQEVKHPIFVYFTGLVGYAALYFCAERKSSGSGYCFNGRCLSARFG